MPTLVSAAMLTFASNCSQATDPVPFGPKGEPTGAVTVAVLFPNRIMFAPVKLKVGVPSAAKKWWPSTVAAGRPARLVGVPSSGKGSKGTLTARPGRVFSSVSFEEASDV